MSELAGPLLFVSVALAVLVTWLAIDRSRRQRRWREMNERALHRSE